MSLTPFLKHEHMNNSICCKCCWKTVATILPLHQHLSHVDLIFGSLSIPNLWGVQWIYADSLNDELLVICIKISMGFWRHWRAFTTILVRWTAEYGTEVLLVTSHITLRMDLHLSLNQMVTAIRFQKTVIVCRITLYEDEDSESTWGVP